MKAFSLLEMLVALTLIGILITTPNWLLLLNGSCRNSTSDKEFLQLQVLLSLVEQTHIPAQPITKLQPLGLCKDIVIKIGSRGTVKPQSYVCEKQTIYISQSGQLYEKK
jgi:prepilin-type N-terminal cleavage/methylation domain-containing protein